MYFWVKKKSDPVNLLDLNSTNWHIHKSFKTTNWCRTILNSSQLDFIEYIPFLNHLSISVASLQWTSPALFGLNRFPTNPSPSVTRRRLQYPTWPPPSGRRWSTLAASTRTTAAKSGEKHADKHCSFSSRDLTDFQNCVCVSSGF